MSFHGNTHFSQREHSLKITDFIHRKFRLKLIVKKCLQNYFTDRDDSLLVIIFIAAPIFLLCWL